MRQYSISHLPISDKCSDKDLKAHAQSLWVTMEMHDSDIPDVGYITVKIIHKQTIICLVVKSGANELYNIPICSAFNQWVPFNLHRHYTEEGRSLFTVSGYVVENKDAHVLCGNVIEPHETWKAERSIENWSRQYNMPVDARDLTRYGTEPMEKEECA